MAYIIQRQNRFYVVTYDGTDSATGRETPTVAPSRILTS